MKRLEDIKFDHSQEDIWEAAGIPHEEATVKLATFCTRMIMMNQTGKKDGKILTEQEKKDVTKISYIAEQLVQTNFPIDIILMLAAQQVAETIGQGVEEVGKRKTIAIDARSLPPEIMEALGDFLSKAEKGDMEQPMKMPKGFGEFLKKYGRERGGDSDDRCLGKP